MYDTGARQKQVTVIEVVLEFDEVVWMLTNLEVCLTLQNLHDRAAVGQSSDNQIVDVGTVSPDQIVPSYNTPD